ncbi:MAG: YkgJ family cysteine cluster protein [Dehalococcoidia bacterium]
MNEKPWYQNGLYFECQRCGNCCSGFPGYVQVSDEEIGAIAIQLGISESDFRDQYTINTDGPGSRLIERDNSDCVFYNSTAGCVIYENRPVQCRTWPFWGENLVSPQTWENTAKTCPGINQGKYHSVNEIKVCIKSESLQ